LRNIKAKVKSFHGSVRAIWYSKEDTLGKVLDDAMDSMFKYCSPLEIESFTALEVEIENEKKI
jgi:hypothetical protein